MAEEKYKTLEVVEKNPKSGVFHIYLNHPRQRNALTHDFFTEFPKALYCTEDAFFSVKEVDLALAADLDTLQRLPLIVGYGNTMELALTARRFSGSEAKQLGLVSRAFPSNDDLDQAGSCVAGRDFPAALCNRKIIGTRYFSAGYEATNDKMNDTLEYRSPRDSDGHGV
ncbi:delta(3,5)-Delta(2,4)-dienoyl-CoA isomerase, peroxisomal-like [Arachis hypogaea]|uniref:delta(3,5)-Delta(2,4)-dienoyl-CoA isomerase, peroxisomal-like n=1 Tax=Arachis hypogaea TaxID=3818 RepID=UPI003B216F8A